MNVIFVNYFDFRSPSGMHIFHLANALAKLGVRSAVYSAGDAATVTRYGTPKFKSYDTWFAPFRLAADCGFKENETVIHSWTPRERVRDMTEAILAGFPAPVVVHMEDNEEAITQAHLDALSADERESDDVWQSGQPLYGFSHPERYRAFLAGAAGYTCIIEELLDFKPENVPGLVFWPSCEAEVFTIPAASSVEEKEKWGIKPDEHVVFYPGNMHRNNVEEVTHLYIAVAMLRKSGIPIRILKFGSYVLDMQEVVFNPFGLTDVLVDLTDHITPAQIPEVMQAADFLVQPGEDNAFNRYRFPCKLPLFMASGRPVVLPPSNLGKHLTHGENCLILQSGTSNPEEIANYLRYLISKPETAKNIGAHGREFAKERFSWDVSAGKLKEFYAATLKNTYS
ncbi:MAG: hypothetical protein DELT_01459 [Desulfovibrio sp.]